MSDSPLTTLMHEVASLRAQLDTERQARERAEKSRDDFREICFKQHAKTVQAVDAIKALAARDEDVRTLVGALHGLGITPCNNLHDGEWESKLITTTQARAVTAALARVAGAETGRKEET